jgi:hypothetical protein
MGTRRLTQPVTGIDYLFYMIQFTKCCCPCIKMTLTFDSVVPDLAPLYMHPFTCNYIQLEWKACSIQYTYSSGCSKINIIWGQLQFTARYHFSPGLPVKEHMDTERYHLKEDVSTTVLVINKTVKGIFRNFVHGSGVLWNILKVRGL